jgi:DNA-binding NarL/FixJ family response regulator
MSQSPAARTVVVVAHDGGQAAQVESALHELVGWRILVCRPSRFGDTLEEHPNAIVVFMLADVETRRMLRGVRAWARAPAAIALSDDVAALWTPASRAAGLRAVLGRRVTADELSAAVRAVEAGLFVLHPGALLRRSADADAAPGAPLSAREREILELMADGATNGRIAFRLGISRHTVKFHVASILTKLGARTRTEAVAHALREGVLVV